MSEAQSKWNCTVCNQGQEFELHTDQESVLQHSTLGADDYHRYTPPLREDYVRPAELIEFYSQTAALLADADPRRKVYLETVSALKVAYGDDIVATEAEKRRVRELLELGD